MLDLLRIKAIGLDLDDTLWPIWPAISRAEAQMVAWLAQRAPASAAVFADPVQRQSLRDAVVQSRPDLGHDMSALRRAAVREALLRNGEDTALAEPAFDVFFEHRMRVELYADALPALVFLASRYPVIAVSNGNADVGRIGIGAHFKGDVSAHLLGVAKPDPRIFHAAAQAAGVAPHEVLHVSSGKIYQHQSLRECLKYARPVTHLGARRQTEPHLPPYGASLRLRAGNSCQSHQ